MNETWCPKCGAAKLVEALYWTKFACFSSAPTEAGIKAGLGLGKFNQSKECHISELEEACRNVVTAIPAKEVCEPSFWMVREQCRKALGETT